MWVLVNTTDISTQAKTIWIFIIIIVYYKNITSVTYNYLNLEF